MVRKAAAKTNDLAGNGTTTSVVLAQGLISEAIENIKSHWISGLQLKLDAIEFPLESVLRACGKSQSLSSPRPQKTKPME
ncbi:hypothetical protein AgCh_023386 [Apium graveolens]